MRALFVLVVLGTVTACASPRQRQLDYDRIRVSADARLRTDAVGEGRFEEQATFVLVDADNTGTEGAYITLGGELDDASGKKVGDLKAQSLWIPAGGTRTFALIDRERKQRPDAAGAKIKVRGAAIPPTPPPARIDQIKEITDDGKIVVQGILHNDGARAGSIMVIAAFHDAGGKPMTRPYAMVRVEPRATQPVQMVGPPGSVKGTLYVGDVIY